MKNSFNDRQTRRPANGQNNQLINSSPIYQDGYQQALDDFGLTELQDKLALMRWITLEKEELDSLVALLVRQLTISLNERVIGEFLNAIRSREPDVAFAPNQFTINKIYHSMTLPNNFPDGVQKPHFLYGNKVRWVPVEGNTDWGIIIGYFYAYARHRCQWSWKYIVLLDRDCSSSRWAVADTAWEEDLEMLVLEVVS